MTNRGYVFCPETGKEMHIAKKYDRWFNGDADICSIDISLQNPRCDAEYFTAMIAWALERFQSVEVVLFDTLYRHNYQGIGHPSEGIQESDAAELLARSEGNNWIHRNQDTLKRMRDEGVELIRWDHWLNHPELNDHIALMEEFLTQFDLMRLIEKDAVAYLGDRISVEDVDVYSKAKKHLMDFIIEELAVFYMQKKNKNIVHLYPGKTLSVRSWMARNNGSIDHRIAASFSDLNVILVRFRDFNS